MASSNEICPRDPRASERHRGARAVPTTREVYPWRRSSCPSPPPLVPDLSREGQFRPACSHARRDVMAGGTPEHAMLAASVTASATVLGLPRDGFPPAGAHPLATGLATYLDLTVVCGPLEPIRRAGSPSPTRRSSSRCQ